MIVYEFFLFRITLSASHEFPTRFQKFFQLSHHIRTATLNLMTYFQKKFRFPFLAPYLYASSRFVADLMKKVHFLSSIHIGNENCYLLTKSENFQSH
ncbi:hypothetical protein TZ54_08330 [Clostridioides difficile]|nr:hypothetical protein TZ54_08330 [Clostridioides difficile]OYO89327.1 hypothetical protein B7359_06965 [Clostridioides difficile]